VDIRSAQQSAWDNKTARGFNTTDVPMKFRLLHGEITEAFDAPRKGRRMWVRNWPITPSIRPG
jgi:hypothetical protein